MSSFDADYVVFEQAEESSVSAHESPFATIQVSRKPDSSLEFIVFHPEADTPSVWHLSSERVPDRVSIWKSLSPILSSAVQHTTTIAVAEFCKNVLDELQNTGELARDFFTANLVTGDRRHSARSLLQLIDSWPDNSVISIESDEYWLPWELIHDGTEFWGNRFILARKPGIPGLACFEPVQHRQIVNDRTRLSRIVNVVGGGLRANIDRKRLRNLFSVNGVTVDIRTPPNLFVSHVAEAARGADIVHFTCHGHLDPVPCLRLGQYGPTHKRYNQATCLTMQAVRRFDHLSHAIVFANACFSGTPVDYMGRVRSFGWAFYVQGVDAFIGTLGEVPIVEGMSFAEHFYEALINKQTTVGEALRYAKMAEAYQNPFWLLYCLYGDPFARKKVEAV